MKSSARLGLFASLLVLIVLAGCTTSHYRKSADKETYGAISQKSRLVRDTDPHFTIEETNVFSLHGFPVATTAQDYLGPDGQREPGANILRLEDALSLAVKFSRSYQARKEQLYLSALSLTLARHQFAPLFSAGGSTEYNVDTSVIEGVEIGPDGNPTGIITDSIVEQHRFTGSANVGASWLIRDLGRITTALTTDFLRYVTGDSRVTSSSQLSATFLRPLLQDAGFKQETEALIQAERQLLYDLRDFTQYRKDFSVQVATAYYGVLGNRDTVRNSFANLQSSRKNAERSRALAQEGRITQSDLGRLEQQELSAESSWINAVRNYQQALDNFKIQLGLSVDTNIVLDDRELESLKILHPALTVEDSIQIGLAARLDYMNLKDELEDSERKVKLAANALLPRADLTGGASITSDPKDHNGFPLPDPARYSWNAGLTVDLGIDKKAERNSYRAALITRNRASRAIAQQQDDISLQVRDSWRTLDQAKRSYEISEIGVKLAERRVEEQNLLAELGRAKAQDQVDAENALIDSKNQLTQALVTHTIARLQFWNRMGILYIKDNGQWEEVRHAKAQ